MKNGWVYIIALFLFSCSNGLNRIQIPINTRTKDVKEDYYEAIIDATKYRIFGQVNRAENLLKQCIKHYPEGAAAYYELSILSYMGGNLDKAVDYARSAVDIDPSNIWYMFQLASFYKEQKEYDKIVSIYRQILIQNPDRFDIYMDLAELYWSQGNTKEAILILDRLEELNGITEQVSLMKEQIYVSSNDYNSAIRELKRLIEKEPENVKGLGILAELMLTVGRNNEALDLFHDIFDIDPGNGLAQMSIASYYRIIGDYENAFSYYEKIIKNDGISIEMKLKELAKLLSDEIVFAHNKLKIKDLLEKLYEIEGDLQVKTLMAEYYLRIDDKEGAKQILREVAKQSDKIILHEQLLYLDNITRDYDKMIEDAGYAMEFFKNEPNFYFYKGLAYNRKNNYHQAVPVLREGLKLSMVNNAKNINNEINIQLGEAYYQLEKYDSSDYFFEVAIQHDSLNTNVLNNYSYYLSLRGENLERARELCEKLVKLNNSNYSYLDTYAWVLYKLGEYNDALDLIKLAIGRGGHNDPVILDHKGDILEKLGQDEEAIKTWEKSILIGGDKDEIERKIDKIKKKNEL